MNKYCDKCGLNEAEYMSKVCEETGCGKLIEVSAPSCDILGSMSRVRYTPDNITQREIDSLVSRCNELRSSLSEIVGSLGRHKNTFTWVNDPKTVEAFDYARKLLDRISA